MSRYSIRVHRDDHAPRELPCDSVYVDDGGDLHVNREQRSSDLLTVARFQHGHWSRYELEPSNDAAEKWIQDGVTTPDEYLNRHGLPLIDAADADMPVKTESLPEVGDRVHLLRRGDPCMDVYIGAVHGDGTVLLMAHPDKPWRTADRVAQDSPSRPQYSWHWPCDSDGRHDEPEPEPPAPITVTINVSGSVISERELADLIRRHVDKTLQRAWVNRAMYRR